MKSKNMLEVIFGKSWRTSLMGYGAAIFTAIYPILEKHDFNFHTDWKYLLFAVGFAIFGRTVKDGNVTHSAPKSGQTDRSVGYGSDSTN